MADQFEWWRNALAGNVGPIHENDPQSGYYKRAKKGQPVPDAVAIWSDVDTGEVFVQVGNREPRSDIAYVSSIWTWVCRYPISEETYNAVMAGQPWPDLPPSLQPERPAPAPVQPAALLAIPDMDELEPGEEPMPEAPAEAAEPEPKPEEAAPAAPEDPLVPMLKALKAYEKDVKRYAVINTDDDMAAAQALRSHLQGIASKADKTRETLIRPHLDAQKDINGRYQPVIATARGLASRITDGMNARLNQLKREADAAAAKAREEARAQELARREEEAARQKAEAEKAADELKPMTEDEPTLFGHNAPPASEPPPIAENGNTLGPVQAPEPAPAPAAPAIPLRIKGGTGLAALVRTVNVVTVTDFDALYGHFKNDARVRELLTTLANQAVKAGFRDLPGITVTEELAAR